MNQKIKQLLAVAFLASAGLLNRFDFYRGECSRYFYTFKGVSENIS